MMWIIIHVSVLGVVRSITQESSFSASSKVGYFLLMYPLSLNSLSLVHILKDKLDLIKRIQMLFYRLEIESDKIPTLSGQDRPVFEGAYNLGPNSTLILTPSLFRSY